MKLNVMKNAKRNMMFGLANKLALVLCPFAVRTVMQLVLGAQYLGLNSLFSSILSILSLTELGFGSAVVYHMYRPIAQNDIETVNALLYFYKRVYRGIGILILAAGALWIPFLPYFIHGDYPEEVNLTVLYLIYLINASISYFMYAYKSSLLVAYQREDGNSIANLLITVLLNGSQIAALFVFRNYVLFLLLTPVFTIANNLLIACMVKKMFPQYHCKGTLPACLAQDIRQRVQGAFLSKLCMVSRNAFDSIVASMFLGLTVTAMYNNYYYVMHGVNVMLSVIPASFLGGVGNHVAVKSVEENFIELKKLDFLYMWISGWCTVCFVCLFQPFMQWWMGEEMMLPEPVMILFCLYFYLLSAGDMRSVYSSANGLWWQHRRRSVAEAAANLILNFILGRFFGIYGILTATILTIFVCNFVWGVRIVFKHYFQLFRLKEYYGCHIKYALATCVLCILTYNVCAWLPCGQVMGGLLLRALVCVVLPNIGYALIYGRTDMFWQVRQMVWRKRL